LESYSGRVFGSPEPDECRLVIANGSFWREHMLEKGKKIDLYPGYSWKPDEAGWVEITLDVIFLEDYNEVVENKPV
jgi:hypothetical protein